MDVRLAMLADARTYDALQRELEKTGSLTPGQRRLVRKLEPRLDTLMRAAGEGSLHDWRREVDAGRETPYLVHRLAVPEDDEECGDGA